jgi:hypothetical protein
MWKYCQEHPEGPFVYGPWDSFPIWPDVKERHARWLKQYLPLVEDGTWAYLDVRSSSLFANPLPANVVASVFASRELHLMLANYNTTDVAVRTAEPYVLASESGPGISEWTIPARSIRILRKA